MNENAETKRVGFLTLPILRDVVIVLFICVVGWHLLNANVQFDFSRFSFTDLLALILALFSIWLSVAFYFKAGETSNQFYDNSYKFTKEMSEVLGRIEAGFGERLRHLDEGYTGLKDRFDRLPYGGPTEAEVKEEQDKIKKREREQQDLLESLANRAKLDAREKSEIFSKLAEKNEELEQARMELQRLQGREELSADERRGRRMLVQYLARQIREAIPADTDPKSPEYSIGRTFIKIRDDLHPEAISDLKRFNYLTEDGKLTRDALIRIRMEMRPAKRE